MYTSSSSGDRVLTTKALEAGFTNQIAAKHKEFANPVEQPLLEFQNDEKFKMRFANISKMRSGQKNRGVLQHAEGT
jgi:hypothetical protein